MTERVSTYRTENPTTGQVTARFDTLDEAGVADALARVHSGYVDWRTRSVPDRADLLHRVADLYDRRTDELAEVIAVEMGKPLAQGRGEVAISAAIYRYYADHGPGVLAPEPLEPQGADRTVVVKEPVGPVLGIMPWNYPYYQVARFAAPNLMIGNSVLLKHAPICAHSASLMEEVFTDAGLPEGAYVNSYATDEQVATIIADPRIQGVSLTGSERAGSAVAATAGRHLKKCVLELGGSDAMIVLDTANLDRLVRTTTAERLGNAGQACNSPKRLLVADDLYDDFVAKLAASFAAVTVGDPLDAGTDVGPLSSDSALDGLLAQIQDAVDQGATVHTGGHRLDRPGSFLAPTVLTGITPSMRAWSEELFGPVAVVYPISGPEEAIELANSSPYGLSGSVWTQDLALGNDVADRLDVGMAYVNEHGTSLPGLPFGGVKRSGFGRELGTYGMDEFVNKKLRRTTAARG